MNEVCYRRHTYASFHPVTDRRQVGRGCGRVSQQLGLPAMCRGCGKIEAEFKSTEISREIKRVLVEFETLGHVTSVTNVTDKPGDKPISGDMLHADEVVQSQRPLCGTWCRRWVT